MPTPVPRREPLVEVIYNNLKQVLRGGIRPARFFHCPELLELAIAGRQLAGGDDLYDAALALEGVLLSALKHFGLGPQGRAAELLFGATPDSRGRPLKDRRRLAAEQFDILPSTFRRNYEDDINRDMAVEVWRIAATGAQK